MATEVNLPALGESVTEGTVTRWLKQVGDSVAVDEPLLEVSTDKVDTEIPSPVAGTLLEIKAQEDDTVEVGAVLALIGDEGESADSGDTDSATPEAQPADEEQAEKKAEQEQEIAEEKQAEEPAAAEEPAPAAEEAEKPAAETKPSGDSGTAVTLPALGESVTEGTVTRWLKSVGDEVAVDEPLLEVSTDKVDTEIPSPVAGTLLEIKVAEDETVEVGGELAVIGSGAPAAQQPAPAAAPEAPAAAEPEPESQPESQPESGSRPEPAAAPEPAAQEQAPEAPAPEAPAPEAPAPAGDEGEDASGRSYVTPLVRKLADKHGVDLSTVSGSGVGGRIRKQDVLAAAEAQRQPEPEAAPETAAPAAPGSEALGSEAPAGPKGPKQPPGEIGGPAGPEPTRYGDWEVGGRCTDF